MGSPRSSETTGGAVQRAAKAFNVRRSLIILGIFTTVFLLATAAAYSHYQFAGLARDPIDVKLHDLADLHGHFDHLILSDSVTENAMAGFRLAPGTIDLLSNGWLRLAGQYLLMKRAFKQASFDRATLFVVPDLLMVDVNDEANGRVRYTYTDTIFTRPDEIAELRRAGDEKAGQRFLFFDLIFKSLQKRLHEPSARTKILLPHASRPDPSIEKSSTWAKKISLRRGRLSAFSISRQNRFFLERIEEQCRTAMVQCRIVIEPTPASMHRSGFVDAINAVAPTLEVIDVNDFASFPDEAFLDALHLGFDWSDYYRTIAANARLLDFEPLQQWNGSLLTFGPTDADRYFAHSLHPPEYWGRWTSAASADMIFNAADVAKDSFLELLGQSLAHKGPQIIDIAVDGQIICEKRIETEGEVRFLCPLPARASGLMKMSVLVSYVSCPQEWGVADNRILGFGLKSIKIAQR